MTFTQQAPRAPNTLPAEVLSANRALHRALSWTLTFPAAAADETAISGAHSSTVWRLCVRAMLEAAARGEIPAFVAGRGRRLRPARAEELNRATPAVENADPEADARARRAFQELAFDAGGLHAWLSSTAFEIMWEATIDTPTAPGPEAASISPLEAVGRLLGEAVTKPEIETRNARRAHLSGWLLDHQRGVGTLSRAAVTRIESMLEDIQAWDVAFAGRCNEMVRLIFARNVAAYGHDEHGGAFQLGEPDLVGDLQLDVVRGRFIPRSDIALFSPEWECARAACDRMGEIRVDVGAILKRARARIKTNALAERRAERSLLGRIGAWLDNGASPADAPTKVAWLRDEGAAIAGSVAGAKRAWGRVTSSKEEYAILRRPGRRPKNR